MSKVIADNILMEVKLHDVLQARLKGENLSKIARELNIPKQRLFDWVTAKKSPNLKNATEIKKLADYLGLTIEQLLFGETEGSKILSSVIFEDDNKQYRILIERLK